MSRRLLPSAHIPEEIWRAGDETLLLPRCVWAAYRAELVSQGLLDLCSSGESEEGPVGGGKEDDSKRHFALRFSGSCARVSLAALDPQDDLQTASDVFVSAFAGGRVGLLDIPCGAGAASLTLLSTLAELRRLGVMSRLQLDVRIVAGDISDHARASAESLLDAVRPALEEQAISVDCTFHRWNVCDRQKTIHLLHSWLTFAPQCREYFVVVANFSDYLQKQGKYKHAKDQLDDVFSWAAERRSSIVWLEPQTNTARNWWKVATTWLQRLLKGFFAGGRNAGAPVAESAAHYEHHIKSVRHPVRLSLMALDHVEP